jgi:hypothetical protein
MPDILIPDPIDCFQRYITIKAALEFITKPGTFFVIEVVRPAVIRVELPSSVNTAGPLGRRQIIWGLRSELGNEHFDASVIRGLLNGVSDPHE